MDEQQLRDLVKEEIVKYTYESQYNTSPVSAHTHNGTDSQRIYEKDLIKTNKYSLGFISTDALTPGGETFTLSFSPGVSHMTFNGFAANNASGAAATLRGTLSGVVHFGNSFGPSAAVTASGVAFTTMSLSTSLGVTFVQASSAMYIDSTTLANSRVSASSDSFAYVVDNSAAVMAKATVTTYTNSSVTIQTTLASNWKITGYITFS